MNIFAKLTKGDSATWKDSPFTDTQGASYTSALYTLTYEIRGPSKLTLTAVADGTGWKTTITTAQSGALTPGTYYWAAYATGTGVRVTAGTGTFTIAPDLASVTAAGYDGRSQNEKDLAALDTEISARISGGATVEYTIGNRSLKKEHLVDLRALRSELLRRVRREREAEMEANGQGNPRRVGVRFT